MATAVKKAPSLPGAGAIYGLPSKPAPAPKPLPTPPKPAPAPAKPLPGAGAIYGLPASAQKPIAPITPAAAAAAGGNPFDPLATTTTTTSVPDYDALARNSPEYLQLHNMLYGAGGDVEVAKAARDSAIRGLFIDLGLIPDWNDPKYQFQDATKNYLQGLLTPDVTSAAQNNPYSQGHKLLVAHNNNVQTLMNNLANRGMLQSSDTVRQTNNEDTSYGQNQYDAIRTFMGGVGSAWDTEAGVERAARDKDAAELMKDQAQLQKDNLPVTTTTTTPYAPSPVQLPGSGGIYGMPAAAQTPKSPLLPGAGAIYGIQLPKPPKPPVVKPYNPLAGRF